MPISTRITDARPRISDIIAKTPSFSCKNRKLRITITTDYELSAILTIDTSNFVIE